MYGWLWEGLFTMENVIISCFRHCVRRKAHSKLLEGF